MRNQNLEQTLLEKGQNSRKPNYMNKNDKLSSTHLKLSLFFDKNTGFLKFHLLFLPQLSDFGMVFLFLSIDLPLQILFRNK